MLRLLREFLASTPDKPLLPPEDRTRLATCVLLLEIAKSDGEFSSVEREYILQVLTTRYDLDREEARALIDNADAARQTSSDLFQFTRTLNEHCTNDEKMDIVAELWRIIYADNHLNGHEDYLVHKMARLLNLTHPQLIEAKVKVLDELRRS